MLRLTAAGSPLNAPSSIETWRPIIAVFAGVDQGGLRLPVGCAPAAAGFGRITPRNASTKSVFEVGHVSTSFHYGSV